MGIYFGNFFTKLNIAVTSVWSCWFYSQRQQRIVFFNELPASTNSVQKLFFVQNKMVRRSYDDICILCTFSYFVVSVGNTRSGIFSQRFFQNLIWIQFWKLLQHRFFVLCIRHDIEIFRRANFLHAFVCQLKKCFSDTENIYKLFGRGRRAERPETASDTSCHYYAKIIVVHEFEFYTSVNEDTHLFWIVP